MTISSKEIKLLVAMDNFATWGVELSAFDALQVAVAAERAVGYSPRVSQLIRRINALVPPMQYGPDNPNTGKMHHTFTYGRENSRVLYVQVVSAYLSSLMEMVHIEAGLRALVQEFAVDEFSVERNDGSSLKCRFWWD